MDLPILPTIEAEVPAWVIECGKVLDYIATLDRSDVASNRKFTYLGVNLHGQQEQVLAEMPKTRPVVLPIMRRTLREVFDIGNP